MKVKIKNQGSAAYKRDLYGDAIVVERQFNVHGTSSFKIKSVDGRIISTKRSELDDITDFFALQLDNPVNVLTQDQARQFLNNSSHAEKYRFFMKGVQLEQLDQDYTILGECLDTTEAALDTVKEDCKILIEKHEAAKKRRDMSQRQGTITERIRKYARQTAWVQVQEQERELEEQEQRIGQREAHLNEVQEQYHNCEARFDQADQVSEQAQLALDRVKEEMQPLRENHQQAREAFDQVLKEIQGCQMSHRQIKENRDSEQKAMERTQKDIDEEYERLNDRSDGREADKHGEIREAEATLGNIRDQGLQHDRMFQQLEEAKSVAKEKIQNASNHEKRKQDALKYGQRQLQVLQNNRSDKFAPFDRNLKNVIKTIEQEKRFNQKPIGPLAWYVRNSQPEWQNIIERTLGGILNNFVVTCREDQKLLSEILRKSGW